MSILLFTSLYLCGAFLTFKAWSAFYPPIYALHKYGYNMDKHIYITGEYTDKKWYIKGWTDDSPYIYSSDEYFIVSDTPPMLSISYLGGKQLWELESVAFLCLFLWWGIIPLITITNTVSVGYKIVNQLKNFFVWSILPPTQKKEVITAKDEYDVIAEREVNKLLTG